MNKPLLFSTAFYGIFTLAASTNANELKHESFVPSYHSFQKSTDLSAKLDLYLEDQNVKLDPKTGQPVFEHYEVNSQSSQERKDWLVKTYIDDIVATLGCDDAVREKLLFDRGMKLVALGSKSGVKTNAVKHYLYQALKSECLELGANDRLTAEYCASQLYRSSQQIVPYFLEFMPRELSEEYGADGITPHRSQEWLNLQAQDPLSGLSEITLNMSRSLSELSLEQGQAKGEAINPKVKLECKLEDHLNKQRFFPSDASQAIPSFRADKLDLLVNSPDLLEMEDELEAIVKQGIGRPALYNAMAAVIEKNGLNSRIVLPDPDRLKDYYFINSKGEKVDRNMSASKPIYIKSASFTKPYLTVVDFSLDPSKGRMRQFVINLNTLKLEKKMAVAHGYGSGRKGLMQRWSDKVGGGTSVPGLFVTGEQYTGKHGRSMRLYGLDWDNKNVYEALKVVHAASYVRDNQYCGNSAGCTAVDPQNLNPLVDLLVGRVFEGAGHVEGAPLYIYYPNSDAVKNPKKIRWPWQKG